MSVSFQNFKAAYHELKPELDEAYHRFMESGYYVLGKETASFEEEYAAYCGTSYCVGVSNGLEALHLSLRAMGIGSGDEVIVPSNTYIATWLAVSEAGATPIPVEPDFRTYNLDPSLVKAALTSKTKAILAVNLYGQPCDYDPLVAIAAQYGLKLAIDNAQGHGALYKGRRVGGIADMECHSFYPSKNLGAFGEAGAITTNDPQLADQVRILRNYGSRVRYHNEVPGYNARLDELQAAFLRVKLRHLDSWNARRSNIANKYLLSLGIKDLILPFVPDWAAPVWHLFVVRHPQREALQEHLAKCGVQTLIHYPIPPHKSSAFSPNSGSRFTNLSLPIAQKLANENLSLPIGPHLSEASVDLIGQAMQSFSSR